MSVLQGQTLAADAIETLVQQNHGKLLAILIKEFNDIQLAEDILQEAIINALLDWSQKGIAKQPISWLLQVARRKAIDHLRRVKSFAAKSEQIALLQNLENDSQSVDKDCAIVDERLRLIFTCCHPALSQSAQIALTLHTLCGLTTAQVSKAFLVEHRAMSQRLVRAKKKIKVAKIPYQVPDKSMLEERLQVVTSVIYLIYNEAYRANHQSSLLNVDLANEAIQLAILLNELLPGQAEVLGLLSLIYFHHSRYIARCEESGQMISLKQQDRDLWIVSYIKKADDFLVQALQLKALGPYQIQAAISGVHSQATTYAETDWQQIVLLYQKLYQYEKSPLVQLNAAVAVSYAEGPDKALWMLNELEKGGQLINYQPFYAAKADILKRLDLTAQAQHNYSRAIELSDNPIEADYLRKQQSLIE